jgi:adenosylhomocysteine nucleosidase
MIGIIGAMEDEVSMLRSLIVDGKTRVIGNGLSSKGEGFEFISGSIDGKEAVLLRGGIGKVNAAVGCALLIENYKPAFVINTGSAGGIGAGLSFCDVVISDVIVHHDVDVTVFNYAPGQVPGMPAVYPVPEELIRLAEKAVDELKAEGELPAGFNHVRGLIASGDVFMYKPEIIAAAAKRFPKMRAVEMESAAVAQACYLFGVPCLAIRALSDVAGTESPMTHDQFLPIASKNSCNIVRRIIKLYKHNEFLGGH